MRRGTCAVVMRAGVVGCGNVGRKGEGVGVAWGRRGRDPESGWANVGGDVVSGGVFYAPTKRAPLTSLTIKHTLEHHTTLERPIPSSYHTHTQE